MSNGIKSSFDELIDEEITIPFSHPNLIIDSYVPNPFPPPYYLIDEETTHSLPVSSDIPSNPFIDEYHPDSSSDEEEDFNSDDYVDEEDFNSDEYEDDEYDFDYDYDDIDEEDDLYLEEDMQILEELLNETFGPRVVIDDVDDGPIPHPGIAITTYDMLANLLLFRPPC